MYRYNNITVAQSSSGDFVCSYNKGNAREHILAVLDPQYREKAKTNEDITRYAINLNKRLNEHPGTTLVGGGRAGWSCQIGRNFIMSLLKKSEEQQLAHEVAQRAEEQLRAQQAAQRAAEQLRVQQAAQRAAEQLRVQQAAQRAAEQLRVQQAAQRAAEQLRAQQAAQRAAEQLRAQQAAEQRHFSEQRCQQELIQQAEFQRQVSEASQKIELEQQISLQRIETQYQTLRFFQTANSLAAQRVNQALFDEIDVVMCMQDAHSTICNANDTAHHLATVQLIS